MPEQLLDGYTLDSKQTVDGNDLLWCSVIRA